MHYRTHSATAYVFQLLVDNHNEGIPVAWRITNKETTDAELSILKYCF